jgi:hypothetical protein
MHYRSFLSLLLLLCSSLLLAQDVNLEEFNHERLRINRVGMGILGSWAIGNIAVSGISILNTKGEAKAFHQMNTGWNVVNLAIAGFGYYSALRGETDLSLLESLQEHESMKQILLLNAGLDAAYIAGGFYLMERAKNSSNKEQLRGFGKSVILQGGFLLLFDGIMFYLHNRHGKSAIYENVALAATPDGIGIVFNF